MIAGPVLGVLEFKSGASWAQGDVEQVATYAADLADFHGGTHGRDLYPVLVAALATSASVRKQGRFRVTVTRPSELAEYLEDLGARAEDRTEQGDQPIDPKSWLAADYAPIPMLVAAARRYFDETPLPHVRHHLAARLEETVVYLRDLCEHARVSGNRAIAFVTGVPGAGKTLVGIRLVYEQRNTTAPAILLSGNGPLVAVLRDALGGRRSRAFIRDLHDVVRAIARGKPAPSEVLVFDEAQRAWDRERMRADRKHPIDASEPDLLVRGAERRSWSVLVGLVGEGQEIHLGEESGMSQWADAVDAPNAGDPWIVHCPPRLASVFSGRAVVRCDRLDLDASIRARRAEHLHRWVADVVDGRIEAASRLAPEIHAAGFPLWLTRDLAEARVYATSRYPPEDRDARYGLLCSSSARFDPRDQLDNTWLQLSRGVKVARWFNADRDDPRSCCALTQPVTQFECQGLELSTAIVCWGGDFVWDRDRWLITPRTKRTPPRDAEQLSRNGYRVILTRSRDGVVVWVPPQPSFDETARTLLAAGMRFLPDALELGAAS